MSSPLSSLPDADRVPRVGRRLTRASLATLPADVLRPTYDARELRPGAVHLGMGAFHRAHQAVYLDEVAGRGLSREWGVVGAGMRRCGNRAELLEQDGLYTVLSLTEPERTARVVGIHQDYLSGAEQPEALVRTLARPTTRLVTLTVTAAAYQDASPGPSVFSVLAAALHERRRRGCAPFTVLSCDNLPDGGQLTRGRVLAEAARLDERLVGWIAEHVPFPASMVDRITPPTSEEHHRELSRRFGIHDRALVVAEPFAQWVVQDTFADGRPPLEEVGVLMVPDVAPYVGMKTRLLNASHLALAYLGESRGHATTAEAMTDPWLRARVVRMMAEVVRVLDPVPGVDVAAYQASVLERLANPAVADPLTRLRKKGSVRMASYVAPSIRRTLEAGAPHGMLTSVVAGWVDHLAATNASALRDLEDPVAVRLLPLAARAADDVRPFLAAVPGMEGLAQSRTFVRALQRALAARPDGLEVEGVDSGVA